MNALQLDDRKMMFVALRKSVVIFRKSMLLHVILVAFTIATFTNGLINTAEAARLTSLDTTSSMGLTPNSQQELPLSNLIFDYYVRDLDVDLDENEDDDLYLDEDEDDDENEDDLDFYSDESDEDDHETERFQHVERRAIRKERTMSDVQARRKQRLEEQREQLVKIMMDRLAMQDAEDNYDDDDDQYDEDEDSDNEPDKWGTVSDVNGNTFSRQIQNNEVNSQEENTSDSDSENQFDEWVSDLPMITRQPSQNNNPNAVSLGVSMGFGGLFQDDDDDSDDDVDLTNYNEDGTVVNVVEVAAETDSDSDSDSDNDNERRVSRVVMSKGVQKSKRPALRRSMSQHAMIARLAQGHPLNSEVREARILSMHTWRPRRPGRRAPLSFTGLPRIEEVSSDGSV